MPVYEIINPSDHYTIVGDLDVCAVAVLLLGSGQYGIGPADEGADDQSTPPILFPDPETLDGWFVDHYGRTVEQTLNAKGEEIAKALDTVLIGDRNLLETLLMAVNEREHGALRDAWHDKHRSSMNNIGARAMEVAQAIREGRSVPAATRFVFVK
jgi:hypothetical protein